MKVSLVDSGPIRAWIGATLWAVLLCWNSACDHGLEARPPGPTGIAGLITFAGKRPDDMEQVAVAVYRETPRTLGDFWAIGGWDTGVDFMAREYSYFVPLEREGTYSWVVVAWRRKDAFWNFDSLLGCYHTAGDTLPSPVVVTQGEITRGIDISVDFEVLEDEASQATCLGALPPELLDELVPGR